jgi:integrase
LRAFEHFSPAREGNEETRRDHGSAWEAVNSCRGNSGAGYPAVLGEDRILPPEAGATSGRQRADKSFANLLKRAKIRNFRFHDLRHTFASWYMMCGGDLYELSKLLGHSNICMTERYAKLAQKHIMKTGSVSREIWSKLEPVKRAEEVQETKDGHISSPGCVRIVSAT